MTMGGSLLEDVFAILDVATKLEAHVDTKIEAATKFYEAVYLMRQYLQRLPATAEHQQKRDLLEYKAKHYEQLAQRCLSSCNSTVASSPCSDTKRTIASDPRSPVDKRIFFNEDSSVIPMPAPIRPAPRSSLSTVVNQTTSQANAKLAYAMDVDESGKGQASINIYLEAAELYLKAIKASEEKKGWSDQNVLNVLRRRLEQTLGTMYFDE